MTTNIPNVDLVLGQPNYEEYLRLISVSRCIEMLAVRGWSTCETDPKNVFDVLAVKDSKAIKIQVRSSSTFSKRDFPTFKTCRILMNRKRAERKQFAITDFDYWFFYSINGSAWFIPHDQMTNRSVASMENKDEYKL